MVLEINIFLYKMIIYLVLTHKSFFGSHVNKVKIDHKTNKTVEPINYPTGNSSAHFKRYMKTQQIDKMNKCEYNSINIYSKGLVNENSNYESR